MKSQFILLLLTFLCLIAFAFGMKAIGYWLKWFTNSYKNIAQNEDIIDDGQEDSDTTVDDNVDATTTAIDDSTIPTNTDISTATDAPPVSEVPTASDDPAMTSTVDTSLPTSVESELPAPHVNQTVNPLVCQALKQWYNSLNGNSWIVRTGWDSADMTTCCSWFNVHCNSIGQVLRV